jgi:signal transduction histidine kinase
MPILLVVSMLPAVLAVPYVSGGLLRWYVAGSFASALGVAMLGSLQDVTGFSDDLPSWVPPAVVVGFTPFVAGMVAYVALTNGDARLDALEDALRTRVRVVAAGDRERRRIERDLHDGVQQRLTGVAVQLAMTQVRVDSGHPEAAETLGVLRGDLREAIVELRDFAHGIYPPALTQQGLSVALRSVVGRLPQPVRTDLRTSRRYPPEIENAIYFCCLEALQNVQKHAPAATRVTVTMREHRASLRFEVSDDGPGFDRSRTTAGAGFDNMADRLGVVGGHLRIRSAVGGGTVVGGAVPLPQRPGARGGSPAR